MQPVTAVTGILAAIAGAALAPKAGVMIVTAGLILGLFTGTLAKWIEESRRRQQAHPRSCASCRFVMWDPASGRHGCMYLTEKHRQVAVQPGLRPETYTSCTSFDLEAPESRTRSMKRDEMGKD